MDVYDLIDDWGLNKKGFSFKKYTRSQISEIASSITSIYSGKIELGIGRKHLSLNDSINAMEGVKPLSNLAVPLLFSRQIWLPDPLYSVLSLHSKSVWKRLPESGPVNFNGNPGPYLNWENYWSTKTSDRINYLDSVVPSIVTNLLKIKPLVQSGSICLFPWENILKDSIGDMKNSILALQENTEVLDVIRRKYRQHEYSIGARLGPIGATVGANPPDGLKEGDPMWIGDPANVIYGGMLNTMLTSSLSADFINRLKGDRLVHDFIRSGGDYTPVVENKSYIELPNLNRAVWEDIVAIKQDSELVDLLSNLIEDCKYIDTHDAALAIKSELMDIERKLKSDLSIMKLVSNPLAELSVGTMAGVTGGVLSGGEPFPALVASGVGSVSAFLLKLASAHQSDERRSLKVQKDVICRISNEI